MLSSASPLKQWVSSFLKRRQKPFKVRVLIHGTHSIDWMTALNAEGQVWRELEEVAEVFLDETVSSSSIGKEGDPLPTVVIPLLEPHIASCPDNFFRLIPTREALVTLSDKATFARYTKTKRLEQLCPHVYQEGEKLSFPCVVKRTDLNAGEGVEIVYSESEISELLEQPLWKDKPYLIQSYVEGTTECVIHAICDKGKILWHCCYAFDVSERSVRRGRSDFRRIPFSAQQVREFETFLQPLRFTGPCNADYKLSSSGRLVLLEINPRLGGSLLRPENTDDLRDALRCLIRTAVSK